MTAEDDICSDIFLSLGVNKSGHFSSHMGDNDRDPYLFLLGLMLYVPVNSYGHVGLVSSS